MLEIKGKYTNVKIMIDDVEETAMKQLYNMANHPIFTKEIVMMPDVHAGAGSCVGMTTELTSGGIIPNTVGVDGGCGMLGVNFGKKLGLSKDKIDIEIRKRIPLGTNTHNEPYVNFKKDYNWEKATINCRKFFSLYNSKFGTDYKPVEYTYDWFIKKCKQIGIDFEKAVCSVSSLGGGNHYIEIGLSDTYDYWVTVHSGSRNFGLKIANYHQNIAKKQLDYKRNVLLNEKIKEITKNTVDGKQIPNLIQQAKKDLKIFTTDTSLNGMEFLDGQLAMDYFVDMIFTQVYAELNRESMVKTILDILGIKQKDIVDSVHSIHNYIDFNDLIVRKGAIRSYVGEKMLIPFNMRDGILLCEGKSNSEWNFSSPHGAGRVMSRGESKKKLTLEKYQNSMKGIFSTSVNIDTLDESPMCYKKPEVIEKAIEPTATILNRIKPVLNIKASETGMSWKEKKELQKMEKSHRDKRKIKQKLLELGSPDPMDEPSEWSAKFDD